MYYINELLEEGVSERLPRWTELHPDAPAISNQEPHAKLPLQRNKSSDSNSTLEQEPLGTISSVNDTGSVEKLPDGAVGGCSPPAASLSASVESAGSSSAKRSSVVESPPQPQTSPIPRSRLASSTMEREKSGHPSKAQGLYRFCSYFV